MDNIFSVEGKVVLVTGGATGIGEIITRAYAEHGARVYISSRDSARCISLAEELSPACIALPHDLSSSSGIAALVADLGNRESHLDILVNCSGSTWAAPFAEYPESGWDKVINLNLKTPFFLTQGVLPLLKAKVDPNDPPRVINIASPVGVVPPDEEIYAYSVSKAGLVMMTRHLAKKFAEERILFNSILPAGFSGKLMKPILDRQRDEFIATVPMKRLGTPRDMAGVALFLGSSASAFITGASIPCDGGMSCI